MQTPINGEHVAFEPPAGEDIEIPENARTRCPLVEFRLRKVTDCAACRHFAGLSDRFPDGKHRFAIRYAILCAGEPTRREILELEA